MTDELKVFSLICSVRCTINSNGLPATFFVPKKRRTKRKSVLPATATYYGSIVYYPDTTKWRMERRCCLLNIIGAHSLDSILLPSDLRLRLFCLILRPLCRPIPAMASACYAAMLLYISTILGNSQASN